MEQTAIEYLNKNEIFHMGMISPINRGTARILYADESTVFLEEQKSGAFMLTSDSVAKGMELLKSVGNQKLFCVHQEPFAEWLINEYGFKKHLICHQAVYTKSARFTPGHVPLQVKRLNIESVDIIFEHYHDNIDYDYLVGRLEAGEMFGGFLDGELCGFIGEHEEGSIGMLEVFDRFRRRGLGAQLTGFMVNRMIDKKLVPFSQVSVGNQGSMALHENLGFVFSSETLHWVF